MSEKITIDNQQVTDGGRVLLNPASATTRVEVQKDFNSFLYNIPNLNKNTFIDLSRKFTPDICPCPLQQRKYICRIIWQLSQNMLTLHSQTRNKSNKHL